MKLIFKISVILLISAAALASRKDIAKDAFKNNAEVQQSLQKMNAKKEGRPVVISLLKQGEGCWVSETFLVIQKIKSPEYFVKTVSARITVETDNFKKECEQKEPETNTVVQFEIIDLLRK